MTDLGTLDLKSLLCGVVLGAVAVAAIGGTPLYIKGLGLEAQLNGARLVAQHQAQAMAAAEALRPPSTP
jgi:hypothetical protein